MNIFEKASRIGLTFESTKGLLSTEDLWNLPLDSLTKTSLNSVAKAANKKLKSTEESFVNPVSKADDISQLQLDIVKHIIAVRIDENATKKLSAENAAKRERIREIIAQKQDADLLNKDEAELKKLLDEIG